MKRYKKEHGIKKNKEESKNQKQDWDKINVEFDKELAARAPIQKKS